MACFFIVDMKNLPMKLFLLFITYVVNKNALGFEGLGFQTQKATPQSSSLHCHSVRVALLFGSSSEKAGHPSNSIKTPPPQNGHQVGLIISRLMM